MKRDIDELIKEMQNAQSTDKEHTVKIMLDFMETVCTSHTAIGRYNHLINNNAIKYYAHSVYNSSDDFISIGIDDGFSDSVKDKYFTCNVQDLTDSPYLEVFILSMVTNSYIDKQEVEPNKYIWFEYNSHPMDMDAILEGVKLRAADEYGYMLNLAKHFSKYCPKKSKVMTEMAEDCLMKLEMR